MKVFCKLLLILVMTLPAAAFAAGAVYAMTNQQGANQNQIVVWTRATNGQLTPLQTISTQGGGGGVQLDGSDSLGSQGSLVMDPAHRFLFAVNTESTSVSGGAGDCSQGTITSFTIDSSTGMLTFASRVSSGGLFPSSLAVHGNQIYVLNAGGPGADNACGVEPNITGFSIGTLGKLTALSYSQPLNPGPMPGSSVNPAGPLTCDPGGFPSSFMCGLNPPVFPRSPGQISFTPNGSFLVVSVKGTNSIYLFPIPILVGGPGAPVIWKAPGPNQPTYFGFAFDQHGTMLVTEPFGTSTTIPAVNASALSSFSVGKNGTLTPITTDLPSGQHLGCWAITDPVSGEYVFTSNNGNGTISSYLVNSSNGALTLVSGTAATGLSRPNDLAVAQEGSQGYLYALDSGAGAVDGWAINSSTGSLTSLGAAAAGLPALGGAQGIAVY